MTPGPSLSAVCSLVGLLVGLSPAAGSSIRPRAVLLLMPGVDSESFLNALADPRWSALRAGSALAVMNASVPGPVTSPAAYLAVGAGGRLYCPTRLPPALFDPDRPESPAGSFVSGEVAERPKRAGLPYPEGARRALLQGFKDRSEQAPGALGSACRDAGKTVAYLGVGYGHRALPGPGFLAAMDDEGSVPLAAGMDPSRSDDAGVWLLEARYLLRGADLGVLDLPARTPVSTALSLADGLVKTLDRSRDLLVLTSPDPGAPQGEKGGQAARAGRLAPVLLWGGAWERRLAASQTTRTSGLLANVDLAPTLLAHLGVPVPRSMEGHPAHPDAGDLAALARYARHVRSTGEAMVPGLLAWGACLLAAVSWATGTLLHIGPRGPRRVAAPETGSRRALQVSRILLTFASAFPLAMLLAAWSPAASPGQLLLRVLLAALGVTGAALAVGRRHSPLLVLLGLLIAAILGDLFSGGRMLAQNLMSDFAHIGARFYGIGNEFEGLIVGSTIVLPFWIEQLRGRGRFTRSGWICIALLWPAALAAVGSPALGADFGGALSLAIGYLAAAGVLWTMTSGRPLRAGQVAFGAVVVAMSGAALAALDLMRPPGVRTHVGELAARALQDGPRVLIEVAARKAWLNVQTATSIYFLGGLLAVAPVLYLWYHKLGPRAWNALARRSLLKGGMLSAFAGGLAVLALNDTGIVAWVMATGCSLLVWLDVLLQDTQELRAALPESD